MLTAHVIVKIKVKVKRKMALIKTFECELAVGYAPIARHFALSKTLCSTCTFCVAV